MPANNLPEPGEFTRIFKRQHASGQAGADAEKKAGDASGVFPAAVDAAAKPPSEHGDDAPATPPRSPAVPPPPSSEPGEFTQYFMGGLPGKSSGAGAQRPSLGVQRPNTPVAPWPKTTGTDNSAFTERFAGRTESPLARTESFNLGNSQVVPAPDLSKKPMGEDGGRFDFQPAPKKEAPGEYTALFGRGDAPPPAKQSAVAPAPIAPMMSDSPNSGIRSPLSDRTMRDIPVAPPVPKGPSEFTMVSKGRQAEPTADESAQAEKASPAAAGGGATAPKLPVSVNIASINPASLIPGAAGGGMHVPGASAHASLTGANVGTPLGSAAVHAPAIPPLKAPALKVDGAGASKLSDQTKLILFFGVLAIVAVILVVIVVAMQKN